MPQREPAVAGQFYPSNPTKCQSEVLHYLSAPAPASAPGRIMGGIVPHAGWVCSGAVAAEVMHTLAKGDFETFVVFGAVHYPCGDRAAAWVSGSWHTPMGNMPVDEELLRAVVNKSPLITENPSAHRLEHSIEVELPFLQQLAPEARLCAIMVPPNSNSHQVGRVVAEAAAELSRRVAFLGSTDLTHYGPRYRFTPLGVGLEGIRWAKDVNDQRFIDLMLGFAADQVVNEAAEHYNACGSGAVAATLAACRHQGATQATLTRHTNSYEVLRHLDREPSDSVGYAGVLFAAN
jgi:AmmeMemoRadiSam system protein B